MNSNTIALLTLIILVWIIEALIIIIVANALTDIIGLQGISKYCCIFLIWLLTVGVLNKLQGD